LAEALEQSIHAVRGDADAGVVHREGDRGDVVGAAQDRDADHDLALRGELHGVSEQVDQHLTQARDVPLHDGRDIWFELAGDVQALLRGLLRHQVERALDAVPQREGLALQLELTRLDLGEIQDVVDDDQQRVAAEAHRLGVVALVGGQLAVEQQPGHADDGVHRRADLVRHGGQEGGLRRGGRLCLLSGGHEVGLALLDQLVLSAQGSGQLVQALPELLQLAWPRPCGAGLQVTVAQLPHRGEQRVDRLDDAAPQRRELASYDDDDRQQQQHLEHEAALEQHGLPVLGVHPQCVAPSLRALVRGAVGVEQRLAT